MRTPDPWNIPQTPFQLAHVEPQGVSAHQLHTALARRRVVRLRHGVYMAANAVPDDATQLHLLRALAEQLVIAELTASDATAGLGHDLPPLNPQATAEGRITFSRPGRTTLRSVKNDRTQIHLRELPSHHVTRLPSGLVLTTVARTAVDLAVEMDAPEAFMVLMPHCAPSCGPSWESSTAGTTTTPDFERPRSGHCSRSSTTCPEHNRGAS